MSSAPIAGRQGRQADAAAAGAVALSAQLLALDAALGGGDAESAASLLSELARELREQCAASRRRGRARANAR